MSVLLWQTSPMTSALSLQPSSYGLRVLFAVIHALGYQRNDQLLY